jgi:hypothetical protein
MLRRRPLLRAAAGTAVVAGTATAVSGRVRSRQDRRYRQEAEAGAYEQQQYAQPPPQYAPEAQPPPVLAATQPLSAVEQLKQLADLRDQGVVTDAEFEAEKAKILSA